MNMTGYVFACICIMLLGILYEGVTACLSIQEIKWRMQLDDNDLTILPSPNGSTTALDNDSRSDQIKHYERELLLSANIWKYFGGYGDGWLGIRISITRSICRFFIVVLSYSLMLITMTFNIGLFFSVCLGIAMGSFLFAPVCYKALGSKSALVRTNKYCC
jgi:hypothetical protein